MTLPSVLGGELQNLEDGIDGSARCFANDPFLDKGEAKRRLVNVVALGDIGDRQSQLPQTFEPVHRRLGSVVSATRYDAGAAHISDVTQLRSAPPLW